MTHTMTRIERERDAAKKGFMPKQGGDPLQQATGDAGFALHPVNKDIEETELARKGLMPKEGGDPLEEWEKGEERIGDSALALGLGLHRGG